MVKLKHTMLSLWETCSFLFRLYTCVYLNSGATHESFLTSVSIHGLIKKKKKTKTNHLVSLTFFFTYFFDYSPAQLEQNAQNRGPGIDPILLWKQEEEEKAKAAAASAPVDVKAMMSKIDRKK